MKKPIYLLISGARVHLEHFDVWALVRFVLEEDVQYPTGGIRYAVPREKLDRIQLLEWFGIEVRFPTHT